jgi:hypothetical protein
MVDGSYSLTGRVFRLPSLGNCTLAKGLGGGLLSRVYRGELQDGRVIAAKITRSDLNEELAAAFRSEYETLRRLRTKAAELGLLAAVTRFPEPLDFAPDIRTFDGHYAILALELVQPPKLLEETGRCKDARERETLALRAANQYAELLCVVHGADLTCADRKIDDLYWSSDARLVVLDWNVVGSDPRGRPGDLFRFGVMWYELLVNTLLQFVTIRDRSVADPNAVPAWADLSWGIQAIVGRAVAAVPDKRYQTAGDLLRDVNAQIERWQMDPLDLLERGRRKGRTAADRVSDLDMAARQGVDTPDLRKDMAKWKSEVAGEGERLLQDAKDLLRLDAPDFRKAHKKLTDARKELQSDELTLAEATRLAIIARACLEAKEGKEPLPAERIRALVQAVSVLAPANPASLAAAREAVDAARQAYPSAEDGLALLSGEIGVRALIARAEGCRARGDYAGAAENYAEARAKLRLNRPS